MSMAVAKAIKCGKVFERAKKKKEKKKNYDFILGDFNRIHCLNAKPFLFTLI